MGVGWTCKVEWCGEPAEDHRLCGEIIDYLTWHGVFSAEGVMLKPSDGPAGVWYAHDYHKGYKGRVPQQRTSEGKFKKNSDSSLTA